MAWIKDLRQRLNRTLLVVGTPDLAARLERGTGGRQWFGRILLKPMVYDQALFDVLAQWRDALPILGDRIMDPAVAGKLHGMSGGRMGSWR